MSDLNKRLEELATREVPVHDREQALAAALLRARKALRNLDDAPKARGHMGYNLATWMAGYAQEALADTELEEALK